MKDIGYSGQYLDNKEFRLKFRTGGDILNATGDAIAGEILVQTGVSPAVYIATETSTLDTSSIFKIADLTEKVGVAPAAPASTTPVEYEAIEAAYDDLTKPKILELEIVEQEGFFGDTEKAIRFVILDKRQIPASADLDISIGPGNGTYDGGESLPLAGTFSADLDFGYTKEGSIYKGTAATNSFYPDSSLEDIKCFFKEDNSAIGGFSDIVQMDVDNLGEIYQVADLQGQTPQTAENSSVVNNGQNTFIKSGEILFGFGLNARGQIGDGTTAAITEPILVFDREVKQVAVSGTHAMVVMTDGRLFAVGLNTHGQLGDGTVINKSEWIQVYASGIESVAVSQSNSYIVKSDNTLWACGSLYGGRVGDGSSSSSTSKQTTFVQILADVQNVYADGDATHAVAVKLNGSLYGWGNNSAGQLADGTQGNYRLSPIQMVSSGVTSASVNQYNTMILNSDATLSAVGGNYNGEFGDGTSGVATSTIIPNIAQDVAQISAGFKSSLLVKTDGSLHATGNNQFGQLGDGTNDNKTSWTEVESQDVAQVSCGKYQTIILKTNNTFYTTGLNDSGQLGDGTIINRNTFEQVITDGVS